MALFDEPVRRSPSFVSVVDSARPDVAIVTNVTKGSRWHMIARSALTVVEPNLNYNQTHRIYANGRIQALPLGTRSEVPANDYPEFAG